MTYLSELKDIAYNSKLIGDWDFIGNDNWRIYYKPYSHECNESKGFEFVQVFWLSSDYKEDNWGDNTEIKFGFTGYAYFDGIRHMYFCQENTIPAYINYPNILELIEILHEIRKLEVKFCNESYLLNI